MKHRPVITYLSKLRKTYNYKHNTFSICKKTIKMLNSNISPLNLQNYKKHIRDELQKLFTNPEYNRHKIKLFQIDNIHKDLHNKIKLENIKYTIKQIDLTNPVNEIYKIPNFVDILKTLLNMDRYGETKKQYNWHNSLTLDEIDKIKKILLHNPEYIYKYLDNNISGKKIIDLYNNLEQDEIEKLQLKYPELKFHRLLFNSFTSYQVLQTLLKHIKQLNTISIFYNGKQHPDIIYLYTYDKPILKINLLIEEILCRILFFNEFLETTRLPNKFIFYLTDLKKKIDKKLEENNHFRTFNINSAVTNGIEIIIYREEELLKSIFHELIHFHELDFRTLSIYQKKLLENYILQNHYISPDNTYLFYECITESLTNILNNIYNCSSCCEKKNTTTQYHNTTLQNKFTKNYIDEVLFSTFQISKNLKLSKIKTWKQFNTSKNITHPTNANSTNSLTQNHFKQDSCVFSYYILKLYILLNIINYMNILGDKLNFIANDVNIQLLLKVFETSRNNIHLANIIDDILKNTTKKKLKNSTLRMTCTDNSNFVKYH